MSMAKRLGRVFLLMSLFTALPACTHNHLYMSTPDLPTTLWVTDTTSGKTIWSMDVPVQHTIKVEFQRKGEVEWLAISQKPATTMTWKLMNFDDDQIAEETVVMPGTPVMLNVRYRPAPELPGVTPLPPNAHKPGLPGKKGGPEKSPVLVDHAAAAPAAPATPPPSPATKPAKP